LRDRITCIFGEGNKIVARIVDTCTVHSVC